MSVDGLCKYKGLCGHIIIIIIINNLALESTDN